MKRFGRIFVLGLLVSLASLAAGLSWLLCSSQAPVLLAGELLRRLPGMLELSAVEGRFLDGLRIGHLRVQTEGTVIDSDKLAITWSLRDLLQRRLLVQELRADRLLVQRLPQTRPQPPLQVPATLSLPLEIRAESLHLGELRVQTGNDAYVIKDLRGSLRASGQQHTLTLAADQSPLGPAHATVDLAANPPFKIKGQIVLDQMPAPQPVTVHADLSGSLPELLVSLRAAGGGANAAGALGLAPFAQTALQHVELRVRDVDLQRWGVDKTASDLSAQLQLDVAATRDLRGRIELANALPGVPEQGRLPFRQLQAAIAGEPERIRLPDLSLDLGAAGRFAGDGTLIADTLALDLRTDKLDLQGLSQRLLATALRGALKLQASAVEQRVQLLLNEADKTIALDLTRAAETIKLGSVRLGAAGGVADLSGELQLRDKQTFALSGSANGFDPSRFGNFPQARLHADLTLSGRLQPLPEVAGHLQLRDSRLRGEPLSGYADLQRDQNNVYRMASQLDLGNNRLQIDGHWEKASANVDLSLRAPGLGSVVPGLQGSIDAQGHFHGGLAEPAGELQFQAQQLQLPDGLRVHSLSGSFGLAAGADGALRGQFDLSNGSRGPVHIDAAQLRLGGGRKTQELALTAKGPALDLALTGRGTLTDRRWDGLLSSLSNTGAYPVRLLGPAKITVAGDRFRLADLRLDAALGQLELQTFDRNPTGWEAQGRLSEFSVQRLADYLQQPQLQASDLKLAAQWNLHGTPLPTGTLKIARSAGDLVLVHNEVRVPMSLQELGVNLEFRARDLIAKAIVAGERFGRIDVHGTSRIEPHDLRASTILADVQVDTPSLGWLGAVAENIEADGKLKAGLHIQGSLASPTVNGQVNGENLHFDLPAEGIAVNRGTLALRLQQNQVLVDNLALYGGAGLFDAHGTIALDQQPSQLSYRLRNFTAVSLPEREFVVSGTGTVATVNDRLFLDGDWKLDRGHLALAETAERTLSKDIVVVDGNPMRTDEIHTAAPAAPLKLQLQLDLGDDLKVDGRGVQAKLSGKLAVRAASGKLPRAFGTVYVKKGTVRQYGQELTVENGAVNFDGAIDNPGLNIIARRKQEESGWLSADVADVYLQITGNAAKPQIQLVSRPEMPDSEKLAWLILGHGMQGSQHNEVDILQAVAGTLLANDESGSLQRKLANIIGVEDIGVRRDNAQQQTFATLGKRISSRAYISLEQALGGAASLAKLRYQLTKRWSLQATAGTESAFDLFYSWRFD